VLYDYIVEAKYMTLNLNFCLLSFKEERCLYNLLPLNNTHKNHHVYRRYLPDCHGGAFL